MSNLHIQSETNFSIPNILAIVNEMNNYFIGSVPDLTLTTMLLLHFIQAQSVVLLQIF